MNSQNPLPLGAKDDPLHYFPRPSASGISASGRPRVTRWTKQAFSCSKFLSPGGQLWANTAFEGSQFYSIGVPKFYSWVNVISVYVYNDLGSQ